jgi:hypothetical protein
VSVADEDAEFLDAYARSNGIGSRSVVVQQAVRLRRSSELQSACAEAWRDRAASGDADLWNSKAAVVFTSTSDAERRRPVLIEGVGRTRCPTGDRLPGCHGDRRRPSYGTHDHTDGRAADGCRCAATVGLLALGPGA